MNKTVFTNIAPPFLDAVINAAVNMAAHGFEISVRPIYITDDKLQRIAIDYTGEDVPFRLGLVAGQYYEAMNKESKE